MQVALVILLAVGLVAAYLFLDSPAAKGAAGERRVNSSLKSHLDKRYYHVLADVTLATEGGSAQIDHIVLSRNGIFIIETKNMSGWIFGAEDQARWTQAFRRRKFQFQNPLRQNYKHIKVVQKLLGVELQQMHNVVAFVGSAEPKTTLPVNVVWGVRELSGFIISKHTIHFTDLEIQRFFQCLSSNSLEPSRQTNREHVKNLKTMAAERENNRSMCPKCGSKLVKRKNRQTNERFLGCSRFPKCRGTRGM